MKVLPLLGLAAVASMAIAAGALATEVDQDDTKVTVQAPSANVDVSPDQVTVDAPYTGVQVDEKNRQVRIRVPYFSGDINW